MSNSSSNFFIESNEIYQGKRILGIACGLVLVISVFMPWISLWGPNPESGASLSSGLVLSSLISAGAAIFVSYFRKNLHLGLGYMVIGFFAFYTVFGGLIEGGPMGIRPSFGEVISEIRHFAHIGFYVYLIGAMTIFVLGLFALVEPEIESGSEVGEAGVEPESEQNIETAEYEAAEKTDYEYETEK